MQGFYVKKITPFLSWNMFKDSLLWGKYQNAVWQIKIQHIPCPYSHLKRYFQPFNSKTSNKKNPSHILRMLNNNFIHVSVIDLQRHDLPLLRSFYTRSFYKLRTTHCYGSQWDCQLLYNKKKKKQARCSWLTTLEKYWRWQKEYDVLALLQPLWCWAICCKELLQ